MAFNLDRVTDREKTLMGIGGLVVLLSIGNFIVAKPIELRFREISREIHLASVQVEGNYQILSRQFEVLKAFEPIKNYVMRAEPSVDQGAVMLTEIEAIASTCNMNMIDRKSQGAAEREFFKEQEVQVTLEGSLPDIMALLYKLETSPQLLRVSKLDISASGAKTPGAKKVVVVITKMFQV